MRLSEITARLPQAYLKRITESPVWSAPGGMNDHAEWIRMATDPSCVSEALIRLSACGRDTMRVILQRFGPHSFDEDKLLAAASEAGCWSGMEVRIALGELTESGIVFAVRKVWGETLYFLPKDAFPVWLHAALPVNLIALTETEAGYVQTSGELRPSFGLQLFGFLAGMARYGIAYTSKGVLGKKTVAKASERLSLQETDLSVLQLSYAYKEHYPLQTAVALDLAAGLGLVTEVEGGLEWSAVGLHRWLSLTSSSRERELIVHSTEKLAAANSGLIHAAAAMLALEGGRWYRYGDMDTWLEQEIGSVLAEKWKDWLSVLAGFGWIRLGETNEGTEVFRWNCDPGGSFDEEELPDPIRVLPSGDILVSAEADFRVRWELEVMAELESTGWMATYRISAESLTRAVENGRTPESLIACLEQASGMPLPETVSSSIRGWAEQACRVSFLEVLLLRCDTAAIAEHLGANPRLASKLGQKLGDSHYIVERQLLPELRKQLQRSGYPPRIRVEGTNEVERAVIPSVVGARFEEESVQLPHVFQPASETKGFIYEEGSLRPYALTEKPYFPGEIYKGFAQEVPAAWVNRLAAYHGSTKRDIMEKAIDWKMPVGLVHGGREIEFLPERLSGGPGSWEVEGMIRFSDSNSPQRLSMTPEMWGEMRLLFPVPARK